MDNTTLLVTGLCAITLGYLLFGKKKDPVYTYEHRPAKKDQTAPRRRRGVKELVTSPYPEVHTLYDAFQRGVRVSGSEPCMGTRALDKPGEPFEWQTYNQVNQRITDFGSGLLHLGLKEQDRLGFYAKNQAEWVIGSEACAAYSLVSVAIYDTLGEENREFVVNQAQIKAVVTTRSLLKNIVALARSCPMLKYVVLMAQKDVSQEDREKAQSVGLQIYSFAEVEQLGREHPHEHVPPKPDELAILMYTSGTTSRPKGVMMTHGNIVAVIAGVKDAVSIEKTDVMLSYLPLAHILERAAEASIYCSGGKIGFYQGDLRKLTSDVVALRPTIYVGVPKVFQRVMNAVKKQISDSPGYVQTLFKLAYALKYRALQYGLPTLPFDVLIFNKVKAGLGGKVRLLVSGGAPLGADCHEFLRVCFGPTMQGYGLTETCGGASCTDPQMIYPWEKAGAMMNCSEVKLVSAGKYSVSHNPPQGEVCISGPNITLGYYEMEEKTAEVFVTEDDGERWFHTGDVGQFNPDGTLSIVGRVKDIFKLDTGEYIAPERLETIYAQSKFVANIFVYGNSDKSNIVAVVVPEIGAAESWAKANNVAIPDMDSVVNPNVPASLVENKQLKEAILKDLQQLAEGAKLNRYEQIPVLHLDGLFWTADTGLVTAALKNKRDTLAEHYKDAIDAMYETL